MLNEKEIDKLLEGSVREVYYVAHMNEVANPFMDFIHYTTKPTYVVVKLYVDKVINAYVEYCNMKQNGANYELMKESMWYCDGSKHDIKFYANTETKPNSFIPACVFPSEHTVYSKDNDSDKTTSELEPSIPVLYTNDRTILNDRKYYHLPDQMDMGIYKFNYAYSDYYLIHGHSASMVKTLLIKINDKNQIFMDLGDALAHANQLEA